MGKANLSFGRTTAQLMATALLAIAFIGCTGTTVKIPRWLLGKWEADVDGIKVVEEWNSHPKHFSAHTTMYYDKNNQEEFVKLTSENDSLFYTITINKRKCTFICNKPYSDTLIFTNDQNDFPKRLVYTRPKEKSMLVWIDNFEGDPNRIIYAFKKID